MTVPICVSSQFDTDGSVLALGHSAMGRVVANTVAFALVEGNVESPPNPATIMLEARAHWNSTYSVPVTVMPIVQRQRTVFKARFGNTLFTRERYTVAVGVDSTTPILAPEPTTLPDWSTESGGGTEGAGTAGSMYISTPESAATLAQYTVQPGQAIDVRYRVTPFSTFTGGTWGAGNNYIFIRYIVIKLLVLPENVGA